MRISDWSSDVCSSDLGCQSTDNCSAGFSLVQSRIQADPYAGVDLREKCVQFFLRLCADLSFHIVGLEPAFIGDVESMHERDGCLREQGGRREQCDARAIRQVR